MAKTRVGVLIREAMGGKKPTAQEGDLVEQMQRFHELQAQVDTFRNALQEHQKSLLRVQDTRMLVAESLAKLSKNTPLENILGATEAAATETTEESAVLAAQKRAADHNRSKIEAYCQFTLEYTEKWQKTLQKRMDEESKTTKQRRIELDHYRRKTEHLRETVQSTTDKGKQITPSLQEKLQRNEEKLQNSANAYSISATGLLILLDEATVRYWRDLHPMLLRYTMMETEIVMSETQNLRPLRNAVQAMEHVAQQHHIFSSQQQQQQQQQSPDQRLEQWAHAEPTQISTRQHGVAELSVIVPETNMDNMELEDDYDDDDEYEDEDESAQQPSQATTLPYNNTTTTAASTTPSSAPAQEARKPVVAPLFRVTAARPYSVEGGNHQEQVHPPSMQNNAQATSTPSFQRNRSHPTRNAGMVDTDEDMEIDLDDSSDSDDSYQDQSPPQLAAATTTVVNINRSEDDHHHLANMTQLPPLQRYEPTSSTTTSSTTTDNFHIVNIVRPERMSATSSEPPLQKYGSVRNDPEPYDRHPNEQEREDFHEDDAHGQEGVTTSPDFMRREPQMVIPNKQHTAAEQVLSSSSPPVDVAIEEDEHHPQQTTTSNYTAMSPPSESPRQTMLPAEDPEQAEPSPPREAISPQAHAVLVEAPVPQPSPETPPSSPPQPQQRRRIPVDP
jgi:hypothetical protein